MWARKRPLQTLCFTWTRWELFTLFILLSKWWCWGQIPWAMRLLRQPPKPRGRWAKRLKKLWRFGPARCGFNLLGDVFWICAIWGTASQMEKIVHDWSHLPVILDRCPLTKTMIAIPKAEYLANVFSALNKIKKSIIFNGLETQPWFCQI